MSDQRLIVVVPYDTEWPKLFAKEAILIKQALGENCIEIHHIGSTAIPGLAAKPVIDMIPVVQDIEQVDSANANMLELGFEAKGEYGIPFRRYFQKGANNRTHQAHVFEAGNPEIERHLKFRDWMREHSSDREAYAQLKQALAKQHPHDIDSYCLGKDALIAKIDKKTGAKGLRMAHALTTREWEAVRNFRQLCFLEKTGLSDTYTWTFEDPNHIHLILYQGSEIIGYTHIQICPNKRAVMRIIFINELNRNHKFGRQFLSLCEKWLKSKGYKSLHVKASPSAIQFYSLNGYIDMPFDESGGYESEPQDIALGKEL